jgi:hypothetical protein
MCQRRPYLRAGSWLDDLMTLSQSLPDGRVAAELSRRYGRPFTRRQIFYWRDLMRRLDSDADMAVGGLPDPSKVVSASTRQDQERKLYQIRAGWGHLLPITLRPRECDILSLLRDHGPLTRRRLADLCGCSRRSRSSLYVSRHDRLAGLVDKGLLEVVAWLYHKGPDVPVYALTAPVLVQAVG